MKNGFKVWAIIIAGIALSYTISFARIISHSSPVASLFFFATLHALSLTPLIFALTIQNKLKRRMAVAISTPLFIFAIVALPFSILEGLSFSGGTDPGFELIETLPLESSEVKAYRTNCGATCSYGVIVRQEMPLFAGFSLTRVLLDKYKCDDVDIEKVGKLSVNLSACSENRKVDLNKLVYL